MDFEKERRSSMEGYVHSTESFGTVDGPGIRFVVFLQGCPMRCQYCHNPDTWSYHIGEKRTVESLLEEYDGLKEFLKSGGITVTGGEPLVQMEFVTELFREAKKRGIHTCLDSSGILYRESRRSAYDALMEVTDLVMLDIKHIDDAEHRKLTGQSNQQILAFAEYLKEIGKDVWIRHVVVPGITLKEEYLRRLGYFLGGMTNLKALDVLPYHTMGVVKYEQLGIPYPLPDVPAATKEQAVWAKNLIFEGLKDRLRDEKKQEHQRAVGSSTPPTASSTGTFC
jgi:pyruvate formate lyase activating enzyme